MTQEESMRELAQLIAEQTGTPLEIIQDFLSRPREELEQSLRDIGVPEELIRQIIEVGGPTVGGDDRGRRMGKLIAFRPGRMFSAFGRRADYQGSTHAQNRVCATALEAWDQEDARNNIPRLATNYPEYGRASQSPAGHVRIKTPFWLVPAWHYDSLVVPRWDDESVSFKEVKILQPRSIKSLRRERYWALWAPNGGPFSIYGSPEKREVLRVKFPYFRMRAGHRYDLVRDAYEPTTDDMLRAMDPELTRVPSPSSLSSDELKEIVGEWFTEWTYMNLTTQGTWLEYQNLLIGKGAHEFGHGFDPYLDLDPHVNERHCTAFTAAMKLVVNDCGVPMWIYVATGEVGEETEEGELVEGPTTLYGHLERDEPYLKPVVDSKEAAIQRYEQVKEGYHYRFDFDPRPDKYRDLWGRYFDQRDPEHGIISDTERMAETLYRLGGEPATENFPQIIRMWGGLPRFLTNALGDLFRRRKAKETERPENLPDRPRYVLGPRYSATDNLVAIPAEEEVVIGKRVKSGKLASHQDRLHEVGKFEFGPAERDTSGWWGGHTPQEARAIISDVLDYEVWNNWWSGFRNPGKDSIFSLTEATVTYTDLINLRKGAPESTNFWQLCELLEFFKFDPQDCPYGYDMEPETGVCTPRLPEALIRKLVRDPSQRGVNFRGHDGRRILQQFYETGNNADRVKFFWLLRTPLEHMESHWQELLDGYGVEYLTMGFLYWSPREFLDLAWRNQPARPFDQRLEEVQSEAEQNRITNTLSVVRENSEGFPNERHGRLDMEEIVRRRRSRAVRWMRARAAEKTYIGGARAFTGAIFGGWVDKDGFPFRSADNPDWEDWMYRRTGLESWLNPVYDKLVGRSEAQEAMVWDADDEVGWRKSQILARGVSHWYATGKLPVKGIHNGEEFKKTQVDWIAEWIVGYAGLDPEPATNIANLIYDGVDWEGIQEILQSLEVGEEETEVVREVTLTYRGQPIR